jgi:hypothetical protein
MAYKYVVKFLQDFEHVKAGVTVYLEKALFQVQTPDTNKTFNIFDLQRKEICTVHDTTIK